MATDTTLNRYLSRGTNAQRLAYTPTPPTPASGPSSGYIFFETDTGNTYAWDGAAWVKVNTSAAAGIPTPGGTAALGKRVTWVQKAGASGGAVNYGEVGTRVFSTLTGGGSNINDANGFWGRLPANNAFSQFTGPDAFTSAALLPKLVIRMRTGSDITSQRLYFGMNEGIDISVGSAVDTDTPGATQRGFNFRYSTAAGDTGWMAQSRDTAGLTTSAQIGGNLVASTIYMLTITVVSSILVTFDVNGTSVNVTTNIPTTTPLGWQTSIRSLVVGVRQYDTQSVYLESN